MNASPSLLLGIDLGAGSLKAVLIDASGAVLGEGSEAVTTHAPQPSWSEQDPADWWRALCAAVPRALAASGRNADEIAGIAMTAGAHIQVLEDASGKVLRRAIMWNDQRSHAEVARLRDAADGRIVELAYNRCSTTWTLPQLDWVRKNEPDVVRRTRRVYLAKDWLRAQLTGGWETDPVDALGTLMFDAERRQWSDELCALIKWDTSTLPKVVAMTAVVGEVTRAAAEATGLRVGTPVVCGTSDTAAETYAAGMTRAGIGVVKLATAGTVSVLATRSQPQMSVISYYHVIPEHWYIITATNSCASAHRWLRDRVVGGAALPGQSGPSFADLDALAAKVPAGSEGLIFHPYLNGERTPYWDSRLRGSYVGLGFEHGPGHLVRALYEGIAYSLRDCLEALRPHVPAITAARLTGGGARSPVWRQILADVLRLDLELPSTADASFGAALIAGLGVGVFSDAVSAVDSTLKTVARHSPDPDEATLHDEGFATYKDIQQRLAPVHHAVRDRLQARAGQ